MAMMIPDFIPNRLAIVYLTGVIEILGAIGLLLPSFRMTTGWLLIVFFILIVPANIHAAIRHLDFQNGNYNGNGINYLWFRIPLQMFFIGWVYYFAILK